jgi:hypothetical protein
LVKGLLEHDKSITPELEAIDMPLLLRQVLALDCLPIDKFVVQISPLLSPEPGNCFLVIWG